jgi:hypothetical protein
MRPPVSGAVRRRLVELYEPEVARLVRMAPDIELELWPDFKGVRT